MNPALITPAVAAARGEPGSVLELGNTPLRRMIIAYMWRFWARPEQVIPDDGWTWYMFLGGRGWGKSWAIACYINEQVRTGKVKHVALMSTNEARVEETQIRMLINVAPPWFRPVRDRGGLKWPNGVRAHVFTPEAPEAVRSENIDIAWLNEIVSWPATKRLRAFENISTASRTGRARVIIDTTASGRNDVRRLMNRMNEEDPKAFRQIHGAMTDNPLLSAEYLRSQFMIYTEGSRRFREEVAGESFDDAAGALWTSDAIDQTRRLVAPSQPDITLLGLDPAWSSRVDADETGIVVACRKGADTFITHDLSARLEPGAWADLVVSTAISLRAAGVVIEINSTVNAAPTIIQSACHTHGLVALEVPRTSPTPPWRSGVLYYKNITSRVDKYARAVGPSGETVAGRLHIVGDMPELEHEMCTHEPESKDHSPGRLDAMVHVVNELAGLTTEGRPDPLPDVRGIDAANQAVKAMYSMATAGRRVGL